MAARAGGSGAIPADILDDLSVRFLVNLPESERCDPVRVCFQAELAHWFYTDYYSSEPSRHPNCPQVGVRDFIRTLFHHCPMLRKDAHDVDAIIDAWRSYKSNVPTYGAILLDKAKQNVLLVQGYYAKNSWGFPKGKVNESESPERCAVREVYEETGFDCSSLLDPECYLERTFGDSYVQLFIVQNVPSDFAFEPRTRNEIKKIQWFAINDIPAHKQDTSGAARGMHAHNFFMVSPFVNELRDWLYWVKTQKRRRGPGGVAARPQAHGHQNAACSSSTNTAQRQTPARQQSSRTRLHSGAGADEQLNSAFFTPTAGQAKPRRSPQTQGGRSAAKQAKAKGTKQPSSRAPAQTNTSGQSSSNANADGSEKEANSVWDKLRVCQPPPEPANDSHMSVDNTGDVSKEALARQSAATVAAPAATCDDFVVRPAAAWCDVQIDWKYILDD